MEAYLMIRLNALELLEKQGKTKYWLYKQLGMSYQNFSKMINKETKSIQYENHLNHLYLSSQCPFRLGYNENTKESSSYNWHENPEIIYVTKGTGTIQYNGTNYKLREGSVFVVNPDALHYVFSNSGISFYFIIVNKQFFQENGITPENYSFLPEIHDL